MKTVLSLVFLFVALLWITDVIGPRESQVVNTPKAPGFARPVLPEPSTIGPANSDIVPATLPSEAAPAQLQVQRTDGGPRKPPPPVQIDRFPVNQNRDLENNQRPQGLPTAPVE